MKTLIALLLAISVNAYSQNVTFQLFSKDPCAKNIKPSKLFYLKKGNKTYNPSHSSGLTVLDAPGKYKLIALFNNVSKDIYLKAGTNSDTLHIQSIQECHDPYSKPRFIGYCKCGEPCNGIEEDFYADGTLREKGEFKNGTPIGAVTFYYPDGKIQEIRVYNQAGILESRMRFDESGNEIF
ncbi:hypothetical protein V8G61_14290 [Gaetbulibacter sp. M240]|uniref:toxin-antitoxin system YwqK family antitoxin n=1 Tax=Gaetbulibacter sp. M240 TaxID=3126511 RepID=UPI00374EACE4